MFDQDPTESTPLNDSAYWAANREAFKEAMDGEELDFTPWGLSGIENAFKADKTRFMYFAWAQALEHEAAEKALLAAERDKWKRVAEHLLVNVYELFLSVPFEGIPADHRDGIIEDMSIDNAIKSDRFALMTAVRALKDG